MKTPKFIKSLSAFIEGRRESRAQARAAAQWNAVRRAWTLTFHGGRLYLAHNGEPICFLNYTKLEDLDDFLYETWTKHLDDFKR